MALQPLVGPWPHFFIFDTVSRTPWVGNQPVARPLPAHRTAQTPNKRTQTSTSQVGFELMIPVFERAKKFLRRRGHCDRRCDNKAAYILNLGSRRIVSFTPRSLYSQRKSSQYPLYKEWVSPGARHDAVKKRRIPVPTGNQYLLLA
jgi:hypothetical protein